MRTKTKSRDLISALQNRNGDIVTEDEAKCEVLNQLFTSVFTEETDLNNLPEASKFHDGEPLTDVYFHPGIVGRKIAQMKPNSAPGPDAILPRVLMETNNQIQYALAVIFNKSLQEGCVKKRLQGGQC